MATSTIDYDSLAKKYGGGAADSQDYDALAKKYGGTSSSAGAASAASTNEQPNALQRFSEVTLGTQHPLNELGHELGNLYHHPGSVAGDVSETVGIPREVWTDPSWENVSRIGGTGIPGLVFGEHGVIRSPLEFGERVTGANQAAEDASRGNWTALPGDVAGGLANLALLKRPGEGAAEQVRTGLRARNPLPTDFHDGPYTDFADVAPGSSMPYREWPTQPEHAAVRSAQAATLRRTPVVASQMGPTPNAILNKGVAVVPEPRGLFPGEDPNYMASVPRARLNRLALSAKPGAGTQLQQLGQSIIYLPSGAGIEPVSVEQLRRMASEAEVAPPGELHGNATPFGRSLVAGPELDLPKFRKRLKPASPADFSRIPSSRGAVE
jgi:hypothetical protein